MLVLAAAQETETLQKDPGAFSAKHQLLRSGCDLLVVFVSSDTASPAVPGISASPTEQNLRYFNVMILGPAQSPYEGKKSRLNS